MRRLMISCHGRLSQREGQLTAADLGLADQVGWGGARQQITNVEQAPARQAGEKFEDDGTGFEKVVAFLETLKVI